MSTPHPGSRDQTRSQMSGSAGAVVQARDVSGGVHFHETPRRSPDPPRQLPGDVRGFVNRVDELAKLDRALDESAADPNAVSVLVISGTAGVGKTSLAIRWAHRVRDRFPDGQLHVNLRGYDPGLPVTADHALEHFLRALGVSSGRVPADLEAKAALYRSLVADRRVLIILDNAATTGQVRPLLPGTASCLVVVTSRSHLPGLVVREGARRVAVEMLTEPASVSLLRTVTAEYRGVDDDRELAELARLCARLPLALRIAAERAAARPRMALAELIRTLRDESSLWEALSTEDSDEADAVRTVFAWSYRALPPDTARVFRLLGLHPGAEFGVAAAAALTATPKTQLRHHLDSLIGANLLEHVGPDRYQYHDLMRAYASDQAQTEEAAEEHRAALRRVLEWYLHSAVSARQLISPDPYVPLVPLDPPDAAVAPLEFADHDQAVGWYETEKANLQTAVRTAVATGFDRIAWQLPAVLGEVNGQRDPLGGWPDTDLIGLDAARRAGDRVGEAVLLENLGVRARLRHRLPEAVDRYRAAERVFDEIGDLAGVVRALNGRGLTHQRQRQLDDARDCYQRGLAVAAELGARHLVGVLRGNLGHTFEHLGDLVGAERELRGSVAVFEDLGDRSRAAMSRHDLGIVQVERGDLAAARDSLQSSLDVARELNNTIIEGGALDGFAALELAAGRFEESLVASQRAAVVWRQHGYAWQEAKALGRTGLAYHRLGRFAEAADFLRRTAAVHRDLADHWHLALTLGWLADTLHELGKPDEARQARAEALPLLADVPGARADALRQQLTSS